MSGDGKLSWFKRLLPASIRTEGSVKRSIPEGLWTSCPECKAVLYRAELERNFDVCVKCGHHMRLTARRRLLRFLDNDGPKELATGVAPQDFLKFKDSKRYKDRLSAAQKETGETDALVVMEGRLEGIALVAACFDFQFMAGSMGSVVGEKFVRGARRCLDARLPYVCFTASGGARMQEALTSLMQMAKTAAAIAELREAHLPYIVVLTDPTTGGVSASLAMLGDVILAEPNALIGFAGPRVIEQTVRQVLPEGFQRSEFLLEHGTVDMIVDRREMRHSVASLLAILTHQPSPVAPAPAPVAERTPPAAPARA